MIGGSDTQVFQGILLGPMMSRTGGKRMLSTMSKPNQKDLAFIKELHETGKVKPVIDRTYALHEVPDAVRYLEAGHAIGKVVIDLMEKPQ